MTVRLPFLLSIPMTFAVPLGAHAAPMDDSQVSIGSRGDGEVIVINDCRPGSVRWNIDGEIHCVGHPMPPHSREPIPPSDPDRGIGGCRAPSSGAVAACGGGGTRRPNREKCMKKADKWHATCKTQAPVFSSACISASYDIAIGLCTAEIPAGGNGLPRRKPCYGPVVDRYYNATDHRFEDEVRVNDFGKPVYWDPIHKVACDDPRGCAGTWLHESPESTISSGTSSSRGVTGSVHVEVPGLGAEMGGNEGSSESVTVEVKYDPKKGFYSACAQHTGSWAQTCAKKTAEMKAQCPR
jgi:hypothetical protein